MSISFSTQANRDRAVYFKDSGYRVIDDNVGNNASSEVSGWYKFVPWTGRQRRDER